MLDLILTIGHHLAVFTLAGLLAMELVLIKPGLAGRRLAELGRIDSAYGAVAGLIVVFGILRVIFGDAGAAYYIGNWVFWTKMTLFVLLGLLSIQPTIAVLGWRRAAKADPEFTPPADAIARSRQFLYAEVLVFLFIPIFAAAMARGYGLQLPLGGGVLGS